MAQVDILADLAATYVAIESTFGTTPSMTRVFPKGRVVADPDQAVLPVDTQQVQALMRDKSVRGLKTSGAKLSFDAYIDNTQLVTAASPATHWLGAILKAILGGESVFAGSTFQGGSTSSSLVSGGGHGSRFPVGQVFLADVGNVPEVVISKSVSTDTITPLFNLSGSPTTGQDLLGCHNYYLTDTNSQSLSMQVALAQNSSHQWTLNGLTGGMSMELARGERLGYSFDLKGGGWTGPSAQSLSTAAGTNSLTGPVPNRDAVCLLQSLATTTRTHVPFHSLSLSIDPQNGHVEQLGGSTESLVGVMRKGMPTVTADLTIRSDLDWYSTWDSDTDLVLVYAVPVGSGATKRWTGLVLYCNIEARPSRADLGGGREGTMLKLRGRHNTMQSAVTTDLARSPLVIFDG